MMGRRRKQASGFALLPRMEARPRKGGKVTYRYHPMDGKPVNLGTDREEAIRQDLSVNTETHHQGTIRELWRLNQKAQKWLDLKPQNQSDYQQYSIKLLEVMGDVPVTIIRPTDIARYLRVERADAPVRDNREVALLSKLMAVAIEQWRDWRKSMQACQKE